MNRNCFLVLTFLGLVQSPFPVVAQAFVNLDFQAANLAENTTAALFPGWSFSPDNGFAGTEPNLSSGPQRFLRNTGGDYSVVMAAGDGDLMTPPFYTAVSMWQTAVVPSSAKSIRLEASWPTHGGVDPSSTGDRVWSLYLNDDRIPLLYLGGGMWGGNIPTHADQLRTLKFTAHEDYWLSTLGGPSGSYPGSFAFAEFDDIQFSSQLVPEPAAAWLIAVATSAITRRRRASSSRRLRRPQG